MNYRRIRIVAISYAINWPTFDYTITRSNLQPGLDLLLRITKRIVAPVALAAHLLSIRSGHVLSLDGRVVVERRRLDDLRIGDLLVRFAVCAFVYVNDYSAAESEVVLESNVCVDEAIVRPPCLEC